VNPRAAQLELFGELPSERAAREREARATFCFDCGIDTIAIGEYYMLNEEVWLAANPGHEGMLCIGCVEERLERQLTRDDFTDAPVNHPAGSTSRLRTRLMSGAPGRRGMASARDSISTASRL
jgi:hypothetical protein